MPDSLHDDFLSTFGNTSPDLHETVLKILGPLKRGKVFDVPSGEGRLSYIMRKMGFDVHAGDIDPKTFRITDIPFIKVDLNARLEIENGTFDIVVCVEGIEHIENSFHLCRELARILKPGGVLVLSTPNILSIESRIKYLLTGYFSFFGGYYGDENRFYTYHINPAGFPQLSLALSKAGFTIDTITTNRSCCVPRPAPVRIALQCMAAVVKTVTRMKEKDPVMKKAFCSDDLMMGENLIIVCSRKEK